VFSVLVLVIRSIYRSIELIQGWRGYLITHEKYFIALDGITMVLAVGVYNIVQPSWTKVGEKDDTGFTLESRACSAGETGGETELETANASIVERK